MKGLLYFLIASFASALSTGCDRHDATVAVAPTTLPTTLHAPVRVEVDGKSSQAMMLITQTYEVTITVNCEEGNVDCDDVLFRARSHISGKTISLQGSTLHTHTPDGTPGRFHGYRFREGDIEYFVLQEGRLIISSGDKTLADEPGVWGTRGH